MSYLKKSVYFRFYLFVFIGIFLFTLAKESFSQAASAANSEISVGGTPVDYAADPYLVMLRISKGGDAVKACMGSVLSGRKIITAAHCVYDPADLKEAQPADVTVYFSPKDEPLGPSPTKIKEIKIPESYREALKADSKSSTFKRFILYDFAILTLQDSIPALKNPYQALNNYCIKNINSAECNGQVFLSTNQNYWNNYKIFGLDYINSLFNIKQGGVRIGNKQKCAEYLSEVLLNNGASVKSFLTDSTVEVLTEIRNVLLTGSAEKFYCTLIKERDNIRPNNGTSGSPLYFVTAEKNKMLAGVNSVNFQLNYTSNPPMQNKFTRFNIYADITNDMEFILKNTTDNIGFLPEHNDKLMYFLDAYSNNAFNGNVTLDKPILRTLFSYGLEYEPFLTASVYVSGKQYLFFGGVNSEYMVLDTTKIDPITKMPKPFSITPKPQAITQENWPGLPEYAPEIHTAFSYGNNIYFILNIGGQVNSYIKYQLYPRKLLTPAPILIDSVNSEIWNSIALPPYYGNIISAINFNNGWIYYFFHSGHVIKINPYFKTAVDATSEFPEDAFRNVGHVVWFDDLYWKNLEHYIQPPKCFRRKKSAKFKEKYSQHDEALYE